MGSRRRGIRRYALLTVPIRARGKAFPGGPHLTEKARWCGFTDVDEVVVVMMVVVGALAVAACGAFDNDLYERGLAARAAWEGIVGCDMPGQGGQALAQESPFRTHCRV